MIKQIFDEISSVSGDKDKMAVLAKYKDNELLKRVLYLCKSKRVKFYIKQIPEYTPQSTSGIIFPLDLDLLGKLSKLSEREITGDEARNYLKDILESLSFDDAYIIERIIDKDPKIGLGTTFINKVYKDKETPEILESTPYMGAISFDEKKARKIFENGKKGLSQIKMDGRYCNVIIRRGEVELESRSGESTIVTGAKFLSELSTFPDCVLNGELTIGGISRYESNGMIASIIDIQGKRSERTPEETDKKIASFEKKHGSFESALNNIVFTVWDTISVEEYFNKSSKMPYIDRLANAASYISEAKSTMVRLIESKIANFYSEAMEHFQQIVSTEIDGVPQEGTILKSIDGEWKDGKPSYQIKMKLEMDIDLKIVGFNFGTKGTKNEHVISSLNCESSDGLVKTRPQGIKEDMMAYITENQDKLLGKIVQVKCNGLSKDKEGNHSLLYPAFVSIREDKDMCDTLQSIEEIESMAKNLSVV